MKLSKEQIDRLAANLDNPWGRVELICDGHRVTLDTQRWKGLVYRVVTYVDGEFKGAWMSAKEEHPQQKFMRKRVIRLLSPKQRKSYEKAFGKRRAEKEPIYTAAITQYMPDWPDGKAALNHLCKVCDSVEIALPEPV